MYYTENNKPNQLLIPKVSFLLRFFYKTRASVLYLGFRYFELRNIYKRIKIRVRIPIYSSEFVIDSGAALHYLWFVLVKRLLTNCLHGKAAELCLASS